MKRFKCFGCQAGGDAIAFVQRYLGKTFVDAVRDLAREVGVDLAAAEDPSARERQHLREVTDLAAGALQGPALASDRGPGGARGAGGTRRLGGDGEELRARLGAGGVEPAGGSAARPRAARVRHPGRAGPAAHPGRRHLRRLPRPADDPHPRPRGPGRGVRRAAARWATRGPSTSTRRSRGSTTRARRCTPWTGRATRSGGGSPRCWSRATSTCIGLHQAGVQHAVALCSTALTPGHLAQLQRVEARELVLLLDGDEAGRKAVERLAPALLAAGASTRVALLPEGEDPDTFARSRRRGGGAGAARRRGAALGAPLPHAAPGGPGGDASSEKMEALGRLRPVVAELPVGLLRSAFFSGLAAYSGLPAAELEAGAAGQGPPPPPGPEAGPGGGAGARGAPAGPGRGGARGAVPHPRPS